MWNTEDYQKLMSRNGGLVTLADFKHLIGVKSTSTISAWIKRGKFPAGYYFGNGSARVWRVQDIQNWIEENFPRQTADKAE